MQGRDTRGSAQAPHYRPPWEWVTMVLSEDDDEQVAGWSRDGSQIRELSASTVWQAIYQAMESQIYFFWPEMELERVASEPEIFAMRAAIEKSGISATWSTPVDPARQSIVSRPGSDEPLIPAAVSEGDTHTTLVEYMNDARREIHSGVWWSMPHGPGIVETSGSQPGLPATELLGDEDDFGAKIASIMTSTGATREHRVFEIDGLDDWVQLVDMAPADVTRSRDRMWGLWETGFRWEMPDWAQLSALYDGVHLTVNGYLQSSCVPVQTRSGARTLLAGWGPDVTIWLRTPGLDWGESREIRRVGTASWVEAARRTTDQ